MDNLSTKKHEETGEKKRKTLLLFLIHPFSALLVAVKNYKASYSRDIVWLFVIFFGLTFAISNPGIDANRHRDNFQVLARTNITLTETISLFYAEEGGYVDVVQPLLAFLVSRVTDNYKILFAVFGMIFGYFYSRNIWYLIDRAGPYIKRINIPIIIAFAIIIGFWNINGFRMWTAAHIFFFGAIRFIMEGRKKGIIVAGLSILFHFSYMLPVATLLLFSIMRKRIHILFFFFVISFFLVELNLEVVRRTLIEYLPKVFHPKVLGYTHLALADRFAELREKLAWHAMYAKPALRWFLFVILGLIYVKGMPIVNKRKELLSLLGFSFLTLGVANIVQHIPGGGRFYTVAALFAMACIFIYIQSAGNENIVQKFLPLGMPALALYCLVSLRVGFDMIGTMTLLGNPFIALVIDANMALIHLIK